MFFSFSNMGKPFLGLFLKETPVFEKQGNPDCKQTALINEDFCSLARRECFLSGDIFLYVEH